jgi:hypothetical protein
MPNTQAPGHKSKFSVKSLFLKAVRLVAVGLIFGWIYAWASPLVYPRDGSVGFGYGMAHGALMPMALPCLLMGKDVDIFASNNNGKRYKIGYICGINVCGLIFFGSAFWRPAKKVSPPEPAAS